MEEDVGVKGTVTRLRRRLSVEKTEDVSSPSTPTKKRGGRLAAKPQLELIDENAQISSPKKTRRRSIAKDMADAEEKPVTPSRRSTRIKSNTSIVSETVSLTTDSPRARRALRRTSQAGSDNEGPATPARQTRRTRKDSASSVENQETAPSKPLQVVEMVIAEEPETETANKSKSSPKAVTEELSPNSARKSRRLLEKRNRRSGSYKSDQELSTSVVDNQSLNISAKDDSKLKTKKKSENRLSNSGESKELGEQLSESNISLLKSLDAEPKINTSNHNKSVPSLDNKKQKRNRTESWPAVRNSPAIDTIMFSDNEQSKKKRKKSGSNYSWISNSNSSPNNTSNKDDKNKTIHNDNDDLQTFMESPSKRKKRKSETSFSKEEEKSSEIVGQESSTKSTNQKSEIQDTHCIKDNPDKADNITQKTEDNGMPSEIAKFFQRTPTNLQTMVYFEDSDSSSGNTNTNKSQQLDSEDQCVPVVKHDMKFQAKNSPLSKNLTSNDQENIFAPKPVFEKESCNEMNNQVIDVNNSCEPMDIDETIHEEILQKSQHSLLTSAVERKSLSQRNSISEESNKSKRKSSITGNDTSKLENKSTMILSQSKDVSKMSDSVQSPKPPASEILSKSTSNVHENTKIVVQGNISMNDLKGTPLKHTNIQKLNMQTSTPIALQQHDETQKSEEKSASSKTNSSNFSESIDEKDESLSSNEDSNEGSRHKSNFIDDEAEEASDDYESGDSRNEEERQYEDEHEIIVRGETLESEEELTNDSDYEKDSFVVSSDAEDDDLLSGSGDDLSMSDKELSMSKKSKSKYNERKLKEQKNASREMFESRHKLNNSEKKSPFPKTKNNRMRIDSESDEEIVVKPKKSKRLRLDSTLDTTNKQDDADADVSLNKSNKKSNKSLQKSICNESVINEKEITICNEDLVDNSDPLQVQFKQEPKTPQKNLDLSVVQFTSMQEIENVEIDEGKSILNQTEIDPLQATMAENDTTDSSENEEIMQNYDSVLNDLNKNKKGKLSSNNLSLNMDKKDKRNKNEPILDQLNLTHTKKTKKIAKEQSQDVVDSKTPELPKGKQESDSLSDSSSIDLKLLFSEDNHESGDDTGNKVEINSIEEEMFVPLRKSTGKTHIGESGDDLFFVDTTGAQDNEKEEKLGDASVEVLFTSKKKQKKNKLDTSQNDIGTNENTQPTETESATKKKKQKKRHSAVLDQSVFSADDSDAAPVETPYRSEKASDIDANMVKSENMLSAESSNSKKKNKKKKKQSTMLEQSVLFDDDSAGAPEESTKATVPEELQMTESIEPAEPGSGNKKKKKNKNAAVSEQPVLFDDDFDGAPEDSPYLSTKATGPDELQKTENIEPAEPGSGKKKKKKKKQGAVSEQSVLLDDDFVGAPEESPYQSTKATGPEELQKTENIEPAEPGSGKKKKKKEKQAALSEQSGDSSVLEESFNLNSNKRKRKSSDPGKTQDTVVEHAPESIDAEILNESSSVGRQKKKRKISHQDEAIDQNDVHADDGEKKKKNRAINFQNIAPETDPTQTQIKKNKKRKERDEDVDRKNTKVSKDDSLHEVHMPPLPDSVLSQLNDKPRKFSEESKVISTSKFVVENARQKRAKPSKYLEESIYIDAQSPLAKKDKSRMKKPKVLPFMPTASISDSGFTTNFQIKKISQKVEFVAEPAEMQFSKETYLQKKGIKRLGTYDHYKKQISRKLSKF